MSDTEPSAEELQAELGRIKGAMGLAEEYPYWWRWWLVEGIAVGLLFPLFQWGFREGFSPSLIALMIGVLLAHQIVIWRVLSGYEKPTTGVPSWTAWNATLIAGVLALALGFSPLLDSLDFEYPIATLVVGGGAIFGTGYLFMGQLLAAYNIRKADRYAFYVGGVWLLVLAIVIPYVPLLREWGFAVLGIGYALHCIGSYVVLSVR